MRPPIRRWPYIIFWRWNCVKSTSYHSNWPLKIYAPILIFFSFLSYNARHTLVVISQYHEPDNCLSLIPIVRKRSYPGTHPLITPS